MVEPQPSKLMTRVRFPSPAPYIEVELPLGGSQEDLVISLLLVGISPCSSVGRAHPW